MWDKFKFIFWVLVCTCVTYLILTASMPFITDLAFTAANSTSVAEFGAAGGNAVATRGGLRWSTLFLYIIPAPIALAAIVWRLKQGDND